MLWRKKKQICEHEWFDLESREEYVDHTTCGIPVGRFEDVMHIYCPKCDARKMVSELEGRLIIKAHEIKTQYKNRCNEIY
ncbi:hypothetical protein BC351_01285 [Paenibacillus ferrarius]|uniref:Uncharacterized protein n=1 Tax=Paenibacillus ferrarius TaxID=1469647 RepID=A0A1V4HTQ9_9BACL|nr:hypothetical protein [Paenibacillus ferrarius]OPH61903.1 hypothetical protein BC351_01285 [Paenibacillus ferrarius]